MGEARHFDCTDGKFKARRFLLLVRFILISSTQGATGAGKTTLLDVLANRASLGIVTGQVLIDGHVHSGSFQRETGYVQQADIHIPTSTVREALNFSASLRQPSTMSLHEKLAYVDEVIKALEMESYANAVIGVPGDGKCSKLSARNCWHVIEPLDQC